jgi:allantoicase
MLTIRSCFNLKNRPRFVTQFHNGNHPEAVGLAGKELGKDEWVQILPKTSLQGHSLKHIALPASDAIFEQIKVSMYPDGGLSRLGLYAEVPDASIFAAEAVAKSISFADPVPHAKKPLTPKFSISVADIAKNFARLKPGEVFDVANAAYGGKIAHASNEHYGPAAQIISPYPPLNMFDGFESARSRIDGHHEEVTVSLGKPSIIHEIRVDFTYFKNNNPRDLKIEGFGTKWITLVEKTHVKKHAGNQISFQVKSAEPLSQIKFTVYPDGGMNRVRVLTKCL